MAGRVLTWVKRGVLALLGLLVLAGVGGAAAFWWLTGTEGGRARLVGWIEDAANDPAGGLTVSIGAIGPGLPGHLALADLRVADGQGAWLTVPSLSLTWSPWALLVDRHLVVSDITVTEPVLDRLPAAGAAEAPPEAAEPFALPELPVDVTVVALAVTGARMGAAVAGQAATLDLQADARLTRAGPLGLNLALDSREDPKGRVRAGVDFRPAEKVLDLDVTAEEPPGGFLGALLGLPARDGLFLAATGGGPLTDWTGAVRARAGARDLADLTARIALAERWQIDLKGRLDAGPLLPPDIAPLLADTNVALAAGATPDVTDAKLSLDLTTAALALTAQAALPTLDGPAQVTVTARPAHPTALDALVPGLVLEGARVVVTGDGPLASLPLSARITADRVALEGLAVSGLALAANALPTEPWAAQVADLTVRLDVASLAVDGVPPAVLAGPLKATVTGRLAGDRLALPSLAVESPVVQVRGDGDLDLSGGDASVALALAVPSLAPLSGLAGRGLDGALAGDVIAALDGAGRAHADLDLRLDKPRLGDAALDALLARGVALAGAVDWTPPGGLRVSSLTLNAADVALSADATLDLDAQTLTGTYALAADDLSPLSPVAGAPLAGAVAARGTVTGPLASLAATLDLTGRNLDLAGTAVPRLAAKVSATDLPDAPQATLVLDADSPAGRLTAGVRAAVGADGAVALDDLRADLPGVSARGALVVGTLAKGTVTLALTDLAPLGQLAGLALAGSGDGRVVLEARKGAQTVQARVALADLSLDGTRLAALEATADANLAGDVAVDVTARDLTQGPVKLESARLQATGTAKALDWRADLAGRLAETFALAAKGHLRPDDSLLSLVALDGQVAGQALRLNGPVDLAYGDGLVLGPLDLAVGSGRLALDATVRGEAIAANLDAAGLPLALAKVAAKGPIPDGTLDAKGQIALAPGADRADVTLALRAARTDLADLGQDVVLPALALDATAALADGTLALQAGLSGPVKEPLKAHLSLPVARPAGGGLPAPVPGGALAGALVWRGDLAELEPYIPAAEHHIAGAVAVDLALAGTLDAPAVTGQADITNGLYENLTWGTRLTDLTVNAKGGEALTITAQGTDGEAGRLSAQANLALDASTVTARVDLNALRFVRRDDLDAFIGGTVDLSLADGGGAVKGDLTLEPVEVRLLDNLPPSVVVLDITEESDAQAEKAAAAPPQKALDLDVTVNIPRRAFVRGRGVDSEWAGRIVVTGTSAAPRVDGTIEIVRGQVTALGKLFQVTRGTVTLDGASPPDPVLDVVAATTAKDLTVTLTVGGRASAPTIALGSDPAMPQDEILARLLFGKNAGSLGPAEALALASAAASLASGDGGVMDKLRSASGLDVLRADTGDKGSPRVSAGKYVAEGVYVGVNRGLDPGSGSVTIEVDVTKSISVESEIGSNAQGNLGVNWTHDY